MPFTRGFIMAFALLTVANALSDTPASVSRRQSSSCPSVWTDIASDFKSTFVASNGSCTNDARAAIRLSFHDCFPGACDGSIILSDECTARSENAQMTGICSTVGDKATQYNVTAADLVQFVAALGIVSCPGGPAISFYVGRTDNSTANAADQIPSPTSNASVLVSQFEAKGFTAAELVALVGAHTTARQLAGPALDDTVGIWDNTFYSETSDGTAPSSLDSDKFLSNSSETSDTWQQTGASMSAFSSAFVPAMEKMSLLGNDQSALTDCSSVISDNVNTGSTTTVQKASEDDTTKSSAGMKHTLAMDVWVTLFACFIVAVCWI